MNQQCSPGREQEAGSLSKYYLNEGQAPTTVSHSTGLRLDISVTKTGPEPLGTKPPGRRRCAQVHDSPTTQSLKVSTVGKKDEKKDANILKISLFYFLLDHFRLSGNVTWTSVLSLERVCCILPIQFYLKYGWNKA